MAYSSKKPTIMIWARRAQTIMPQISGSNLKENHKIETCKEVGCVVSTQEIAALKELKMKHLTS
jgi:hypothetical protein